VRSTTVIATTSARRAVESVAAAAPSTSTAATKSAIALEPVVCNGEAVTIHRRAEVMRDESAVLRNQEIVMPVIVTVVGRIPPSAGRVVAACVHGSSAISVTAWVNVVTSRECQRCNEQNRQRYKFNLHLC
jgi:hypothetical protein